jgi:hypothetical protein
MSKRLSTTMPPARSGKKSTAFASLLNAIDPEREAQHEEFLRRRGRQQPPDTRGRLKKKPKKVKKPCKRKEMTFEEKLAITNVWLAATFPSLFDPSQPPKPLDVHVVRDIKEHYRQHHVKSKYPPDLAIKGALRRYMESPAYLSCLVKGAPRYNVKGEVSGVV